MSKNERVLLEHTKCTSICVPISLHQIPYVIGDKELGVLFPVHTEWCHSRAVQNNWKSVKERWIDLQIVTIT
jgi:hypothetical protein